MQARLIEVMQQSGVTTPLDGSDPKPIHQMREHVAFTVSSNLGPVTVMLRTMSPRAVIEALGLVADGFCELPPAVTPPSRFAQVRNTAFDQPKEPKP